MGRPRNESSMSHLLLSAPPRGALGAQRAACRSGPQSGWPDGRGRLGRRARHERGTTLNRRASPPSPIRRCRSRRRGGWEVTFCQKRTPRTRGVAGGAPSRTKPDHAFPTFVPSANCGRTWQQHRRRITAAATHVPGSATSEAEEARVSLGTARMQRSTIQFRGDEQESKGTPWQCSRSRRHRIKGESYTPPVSGAV
jgi:hypothetical protein